MINITRTALYCVSAVALALAVSSTAFAQGVAMDKPMAGPSAGQGNIKVVAENEKVRVIDAVEPPGFMAPMASRAGRVLYCVHGGTYERTYADGSKEVVIRKTGQTYLNDEKRPYSVKNVGKTTIHLIEVILK